MVSEEKRIKAKQQNNMHCRHTPTVVGTRMWLMFYKNKINKTAIELRLLSRKGLQGTWHPKAVFSFVWLVIQPQMHLWAFQKFEKPWKLVMKLCSRVFQLNQLSHAANQCVGAVTCSGLGVRVRVMMWAEYGPPFISRSSPTLQTYIHLLSVQLPPPLSSASC